VQTPAPINNTLSLNGGGSGGIGAFATTENTGVVAETSGNLWRDGSPLLEKQEDKFAHSASSDLLESVCSVEKLKCTRFG